jgi:hypothetical protein
MEFRSQESKLETGNWKLQTGNWKLRMPKIASKNILKRIMGGGRSLLP